MDEDKIETNRRDFMAYMGALVSLFTIRGLPEEKISEWAEEFAEDLSESSSSSSSDSSISYASGGGGWIVVAHLQDKLNESKRPGASGDDLPMR